MPAWWEVGESGRALSVALPRPDAEAPARFAPILPVVIMYRGFVSGQLCAAVGAKLVGCWPLSPAA